MRQPGAPRPGHRPTRLIVDLGAIETNARSIQREITAGARFMAVVKANAYGHGAVDSARAALRGGASDLGVATVAEASELRQAGIEAPILVLGSSDPTEAPIAAQLDVAIGVGDMVQAERLLASRSDSRQLHVHLKIDTGMRRFGVHPSEAVELAYQLASDSMIQLDGVYSHFAESDELTTVRMDEQLSEFQRVRAELEAAGFVPPMAHISNSAALLRNRSADLDMVRAGICLYGIAPSEHVNLFDGMKPALEWRATVQHIFEMTPGDRTGYGGTYVATGQERIGIVPVGYADGFPRALSNKGWVGFQGHRLPVRGRVSMDQCAVGIPDGVELSVGDEVTLIGDASSGAATANQLAAEIDTIGYEIVARISRRVPVEYIDS